MSLNVISIVFHACEAFGLLYALFYFITVFYMLVEAGNSRVEDVGKTVFAQIFLGKDAINPSVAVVFVQPEPPQVSNAAHVILVIL
jgi:hypothetical protein